MEIYNNSTILITGITGFLGRHLVKYLYNKNINIKIIGIANSQYKIAKLNKIYPDLKIYAVNMTSHYFNDVLDTIFNKYNIDYIIHTAAIKYIEIAENNIMTCLQTNVIATDTLIRYAKLYNVSNLIAISTDKANLPKNIYGMSKYMMEKLVLDNNYSVFQGVNFFWSDGSVFDIWYKQYINDEPLTISNLKFIRYFNLIDDICFTIIHNLDTKGIILPKNAYKISLEQCLYNFTNYFNYHNYICIGEQEIEKNIEDISPEIKIVELTDLELLKIISNYKQYIWLQ